MFIPKARECYELMQDPPFSPVFRLAIKDIEYALKENEPLSESRAAILRIGIDLKYIINNWLAHLEKCHGSKRVERLIDYIANGYISRFSWHQQRTIKQDARKLWIKITEYRISSVEKDESYIDNINDEPGR